MRLLTLSLEHFRSYDHLTLSLEGDTHVFFGPNAAGKTNILEAVSILSSGGSFLRVEEDHLIRWENEFYRIRAEGRTDAGEGQSVEVVSQSAPRRARACFLNDVRVPMGRIIGSIPTVTFLPQDLELFSGPPARRRALLNELLRQVSPEFVQSLTVYERTLKQRNMLLKRIGEGIGQEQDLVVWDEILAREGAFITLSHLELLNVLQCTLVEELSSLGESWGDVRLAYDRSGSALERRKMEEELLGALRHFRPRDLELRATTVGPHRHDWHMDVDGRSLPGFASRGQQRTAVVALLFLQVSYMELRRNEKPVVLLDDVFSELDDDHQSRLFESLAGHQVLLTATRLPSPMEGAVVWEVEGGAVHPQRALRPKVASVH